MRDAKTVIETVLTARRHDIEQYALTVEGIKKGDITKDRAYQRNYNGFIECAEERIGKKYIMGYSSAKKIMSRILI